MERMMSEVGSGRMVMMSIKSSLTLLIALSILVMSARATDDIRPKVGYLTHGLSELRFKDGRLAFKIWMQELSANDDIDIDVGFYDDYDEIRDAYDASGLALIGLNPVYYLYDGAQYDTMTTHYWTAQRAEQRLEKFLLLVSKKRKVESLSDLKGRSIVLRDQDLLGKLFLDKLLLEEQGMPGSDFSDDISLVQNSSTAILKTYFGKADACVVPEHVYKTAIEMNPALKKELEVLEESPRIFVPVLLMINSDTDETVYEVFKRSALSLEGSARGRSILALFKMRGLYELSPEALRPLQRFYGEYEKSRLQYKGRR